MKYFLVGSTLGVWRVRDGTRSQGASRTAPGDALGRATARVSRVSQDVQTQRAPDPPSGDT